MLRRLAAGALAAGTVLLGVPAAAQAASGTITILSASSPSKSPGALRVVIESTTPVKQASITAQLSAQGSSTPALTVSDFTLTGGTNSGGTTTTWTVASPITQAELSLGSYTIAVQAADTGGDTADDPDSGTLAFIIYPTVTLSVSPTTVSYGQTVTLRGTDIGRYPDGTTKPVAGQQISIPGAGGTTTDSHGDFTVTAQAGIGEALFLADGAGLHAEAEADATTAFANSNTVPVTAVADPIRFTNLAVSPAEADFGAAVTVTGDVSYDSVGTWLPYADEGVSASSEGVSAPTRCGDCSGPGPWTGATGNDGSFSVQIAGGQGSDEYRVDPTGPAISDLPWFSYTPATFVVHVDHVPARDAMYYAIRTVKGGVTLRGCIAQSASAAYAKAMAPFPAAAFQYATSASGPWKTLSGAGSVSAYSGPPRYVGGCYRTTVHAPGRSVYYRMLTHASAAYQAATSGSVKATPPARITITGFKASPRRIRAGGRVRATGQLNYGDGLPNGVPRPRHRVVQILFRPHGSGKWQVLTKVAVNAYADFSARVVLRHSGDIAARFIGTLYIYPYQTRAVYIHVS